MSINDKFTGLDFEKLIGAPLKASVDANEQLAKSTADFIQNVNFDKNEQRTVSFKYKIKDDENNKINIDVPLLALVPIPSLNMDEINILFDMEVKDTTKDNLNNKIPENNENAKSSMIDISINGSKSSHIKNTKRNTNESKYEVNLKTVNEMAPESLKILLEDINERVSIKNNKENNAEKDKVIQDNISSDYLNQVDELIKKSIEKIELCAKAKIEYYDKIYNNLIEKSNTEEEKIKYKNALDIFKKDINILVNDFKNINSLKYEMVIDNIDKDLIKEPLSLEDDPLFQIINDVILLKVIKHKSENK
ncbi:hypothetical protein ANASTE_01038 [Anaerofustis stercorihominis DSM 17244]|uniref:DUF2589 domain-containing protein n=1 Tax=Anaerofustis stercorihominis DSM 17244 TaxID=445971 RepID=B1CAP2_9FIRM|nr:DUF2589 domain-containing protein [Anaerofustis stercorihominis]EDS71339.1 hypothetical protein ANASTE_01038 [Anaerofustis stercorihominis DSM 17244]